LFFFLDVLHKHAITDGFDIYFSHIGFVSGLNYLTRIIDPALRLKATGQG
jgi:hypothetical protein